MGRWLEVLRSRPEKGPRALLSDYRDDIITEMAPDPLLFAGTALPDDFQEYFPKLWGLLSSGEYEREDEKWLLSPGQVSAINQEFCELRRLCRGEAGPYPYSSHLDTDQFMDRWRGLFDPKDFEDWLCHLEIVLQRAIVEKAWMMFTL